MGVQPRERDSARHDTRHAAPSQRLLAIVPAYNEQASIAAVVRSLRLHVPDWDVVVIDDGSLDATAKQAATAGAHVVRLPYNLGIGGAVQTGFVYARELGYDYAAQVDGDGQHDPEELRKLLAVLREDPSIDVAGGSRFLTDEHGYRAPIARRTGIKLFATLLTLMLREPVSDPTSGFRLYNRRAIELFARDYPHDYPEVEAILMLRMYRLRFREVPVRMHVRSDGCSSIGARASAYYMIKVSLALLAGVTRGRHGDLTGVVTNSGS